MAKPHHINSCLLFFLLMFSGLNTCLAGTLSEDMILAYDQNYPTLPLASLKQAIIQKEVFLIDVNGMESYQKGHLPGALSFYNKVLLEQHLPALKSYPIVVYCGGPKCPAWHKAADFARARGYSNISHFREGTKGWLQGGEELEQELSD